MQDRIVKSLGKVALLVAGAGYGMIRGFSLVGGPRRGSRVDNTETRLDELEARLVRVENKTASAGRSPANAFVNHGELAATVETAVARIRTDVERRFETQSLAIGSLRGMISQTDVLLNKVLRRLESSHPGARSVDPDPDSESLLSH